MDLTHLFDGRKIDDLPSTKAEARAQGVKHYFTGRACPRGHISLRYVSTGGCRGCLIEQRAEHRALNPEASRKAGRAWSAANRERHLATSRAWKEANRDRNTEISLAWKNENPEYFREYSRAWRAANPEKFHENLRAWRESNPDKFLMYNRNRRARKKGAEGFHTTEDVAKIRAEQIDKCVYCRIDLKGKGQLDHIEPLSKGGSNWPSNLQFLCRPCNQSKHARDPIEFSQALGKLAR